MNQSQRILEALGEEKTVIAQWGTGGGRSWIELYKDAGGYTYKSDNGGGVMQKFPDDDAAIAWIEKTKVPDQGSGGAKLKRVK